MGPVVTVNSATLVNKGLEVIEAHLLFGIPFDRIEVVVHPTSVVHSMVEFFDGSTLAQASPPSMLIPIALGMGWPDRVPDAAPAVDWTKPETWEFFPLDTDAFPAVGLAREAGARRRHGAGGLQRGQRGVRRGVPRRGAEIRPRSCPRSPGAGASTTYARPSHGLTVDDVLDADAWARARARPTERTGEPRTMTVLLFLARGAALHGRAGALDGAARGRPPGPGKLFGSR